MSVAVIITCFLNSVMIVSVPFNSLGLTLSRSRLRVVTGPLKDENVFRSKAALVSSLNLDQFRCPFSQKHLLLMFNVNHVRTTFCRWEAKDISFDFFFICLNFFLLYFCFLRNLCIIVCIFLRIFFFFFF